MQYKRGMYGGAFDPLHTGHLNCMVQAASRCEELYIVLSYSRKRDRIPSPEATATTPYRRRAALGAGAGAGLAIPS